MNDELRARLEALPRNYEWADAVLGNVLDHVDELPALMAELAIFELDGAHVPFSEIALAIDPPYMPQPEHGLLSFWQADGSGGCWAVWGFRGQDILQRPVVFCGSEGALRLATPALETFLRLTTLGVDLGELEDMSPEARRSLTQAEPSKRLAAFRTWLRETTGLETCVDPEPMLETFAEARAAFDRKN